MAPRNPGLVQSDAPLLLADLIRELSLIGPGVGLLGFSDQIAPVFIVGSRGLVIDAQDPVYRPAEVFSNISTATTAGVALIDTGELEAGDFDIICGISGANPAAQQQNVQLLQRNAGNTANVAAWPLSTPAPSNASASSQTPLKFSMKVLQDERYLITPTLTDATMTLNLWLMVRRRADVT